MTFPLGAGQRIAAADLNAMLPDGMVSSSYTPVLTGTTTNPTLGTGAVQVGRYYRLGKLVVLAVRIQFGTSGVAAGSGDYHVSVPVNVASLMSTQGFRVGRGTAYDASANTYRVIEAAAVVGVAGRLLFLPDQAGVVGAGTPFAWSSSDRLDFVAFYEGV